jgi:ketosteroid isomerase-like protein
MTVDEARRIYELWDEALGKKDVGASVSLYAPNATLESALVRHLTGSESGVIEGRTR